MKGTIVGLDIAKHVFQLHGADREGRVVLRRKLRREQVVSVFRQPADMYACHFHDPPSKEALADGMGPYMLP